MKRFKLKVLQKFFLIFLCCNVSKAQNVDNGLLFGKSQVNITPGIPVNLHGYPQQRISTGIDDSLYCRVAYFQLDDKELVVISNDVCIIPDEVYKVLKDSLMMHFGFEQDEIFLAATHTHSGPEITLQETYSYKDNIVYTKTFISKVILAVKNARNNVYPANIYFATGKCDVAVNRRLPVETSPSWPGDGGFIAMASNPDGIVDHDVQVINILNDDEQIKASLFSYGCHNRARPPGSTRVSNDFFGVASTQLESYFRQRYSNNAIALPLAGASGDIDPLHAPGSFGYTDGNMPDPSEMGEELKTSVKNTLFYHKEIAVNKISTKFFHLQLPPKNYFTYSENPNLPERDLNITIATIGDICMIGIGAEVCVEVGLSLKKLSPFKNTIIITNCNGASGYLPSENMYAEKGYEVSGSLFAPGAANQVISETVRVLDSLYQFSATSISKCLSNQRPEFSAKMYPVKENPGCYLVKFNNVRHGLVRCQMFTIDGKIIYNETFKQCNDNFSKHIDLKNMHGMFLLKSVSGKSTVTNKIIIN